MERGADAGTGAAAVEVGPPEVEAKGADRREAEGVASVGDEVDVATHGGRAGVPEAGVGGGDGVDHGLRGGGAVEEEAPGEGGVGLGIVDDEGNAVGARAHPVEDVGEGDGGVDRIGGGGGGGDADGHNGVVGEVAVGGDFDQRAGPDPFHLEVARINHQAVDLEAVVGAHACGDGSQGVARVVDEANHVEFEYLAHVAAVVVVEAGVVGGEGVERLGDDNACIVVESDAPGVGGGVVERVDPVDDDDGAVGAVAHPEEDVVVADGSRGGSGVGGSGAVGVGGGGGGSHAEVATATDFHQIAVGHGIARVAHGGPGTIDGVAPVVVLRGESNTAIGVGNVGQCGGGAIAKAAVVRLDTVDDVERRHGAVPTHTPCEGGGGAVIVPCNDDHGTIRSCANPVLYVGGGEVDSTPHS